MDENGTRPDRRDLLRAGAVIAAGAMSGAGLAAVAEAGQPRIIKTLTFMVRKPGTTHEEFMRYWLDVHAPMALKVPGMRGMICNEITSASNGNLAISSGASVMIDGVAESWKEETSSLQNPAAPEAAKAWYADGPIFVGQIKGFRVRENVFVRPRRGGTGLIALLKRKPEQSHAQFADHWLNVHGPMAHEVPEVAGLILNEVTSEARRSDIPPLTGFGEIDGIAQSFRHDMDAPLSPQRERWYADGQASIGEAIGYRTREHVIIQPS
ncbi:EthD family reductase [Hephaestia sp. GCM10023244]|uniref:EthD domain-containing protein n=1 Tax=unclassified Hephaestia TaxID=2631281 RepID=UPI0020771B4F|nr:EthD family reductase [Hephaestia sp. MAHUQ-44]MCM8732037.1 EthD family reductase [Hephaestia sp. MAHUQ-44]